MAHECRLVIDRDGMTSPHTYFRILEPSTQILQRGVRGNNIGAYQDHNPAARLFEKQVDGRSLPLALLLKTQSNSRFLACNFSYNRYSMVCTTAGHDDDFFDAQAWALLFENRADGAANIGFFVIGHNADATADTFLLVLCLLTIPHRANLYVFCYHDRPDLSLAGVLITGRLRRLADLPELLGESVAATISLPIVPATLASVGIWQSILV